MADPVVELDVAEPRLAQRHELALLDPAAEVARFGVAHDLARVAHRLQVTGDEFVERRAFRAGDLDGAVARWRERHIGNIGRHVIRGDGLEQAGRNLDDVSIRTRSGDAAEEFEELGRADDGAMTPSALRSMGRYFSVWIGPRPSIG